MPIPETVKTEAPSIPQLKKDDDRERRGAGFIWTGSGASSIGSEFFGASQSGILGMGRIAAALGRIFGGSSTVVGRLLLSKIGSWLVLGGITASFVGAMAAGAWLMTRVFPAPQNSAYAPPTLDGISDSIRVQRGGSGGPNVRTTAGARYDDGGVLRAAPVPPNTEETASPVKDAIAPTPVQPQPPATDALLDQAKKSGLDMNALKGLSAGAGGAGTSAGVPNLQKQTLASNDFQLKKNFVPASNFVQLKNLTPFDQRRPLVSTREAVQNAKSQRAMGQLKFARDLSSAGTTAGGQEAGKSFSTDAFEQGKTSGGDVGGLSAGDTIAPPGDGAPDLTKDLGTNVTPYQNQVDQAQQNDGSAAALKIAGIAAIAAGLALLMMAMKLLSDPATAQQGMMLAMAGIALILAGIAMLMMADKLGKQAKNQGNNIANQYGQQQQGQTINNCSSQAVNNGTSPQNCSTTFFMPGNNVQSSVATESNSTYSLDGGNPIH